MGRPSSATISHEELLKTFRAKEFAPLYLFYGDEEYLVDECVDELIAAAVDTASREFDLDVVYGSETTANDIVNIASSYPMRGARRVVVVREFDKLANKEPLVPYVERPSPSTSLVVLVSRPDFRMKLFKVMAENAVSAEFKSLYETEISGWITRNCERRGSAISLEAAELIHAYVGQSLRELRNEIDKLFLYIGERTAIGVDDVNAVVGMSKQFNMYELQASVGAQDFGKALEIVEHMLQTGESAIGLVTMLTRYYEKLWLIADCMKRNMPKQEIASVLKFSPKQMHYLEAEMKTARRFSPADIEDGFRALVEADERLKTSNGSISVIMTILLHRLFRRESPVHKSFDYA